MRRLSLSCLAAAVFAAFFMWGSVASAAPCKTYEGCSGGGATPTADFDALAAIDGETTPLVMVTNCNDASCTAGGGTTRVLKFWDGDSWENQASAGSAANLASAPDADSVVITNSNGTGADIAGATASLAGSMTAADKQKVDMVYMLRDVGGAAGLDQTDVEAAIQASCTIAGELLRNCYPIVFPRDSTTTITDTIHITADGLAPSATVGEGAWQVVLRGAGSPYLQNARPTAGAASRCSSTIQWDGATSAPMIHAHAPRRVVIENLCLNGVGATTVASHGILFTASPESGEISQRNLIQDVEIFGFRNSWEDITTQEKMIGIALKPSNWVGDPPYDTDVQIDSLTVRRTAITAHRGFLGANGFTNGIVFEDSWVQHADYGYWAEDSDLTIRGGFTGSWARRTALHADAFETAVCTGTVASILVGSSSADPLFQPQSVNVYDHYSETDCGLGIGTVASSAPSTGTRTGSFAIHGGTIAVGGSGQTSAIRYDHWGTFSLVGTKVGVRWGEVMEDGLTYLNPPSGGTLRYIYQEYSGSDLVAGANARPSIDAQQVHLADAYSWTGAHTFTNIELPDDSVDIADLSAGGTASATTFLRGDNTWATPAGGGGNAFTTFDVTTNGGLGTNPVADLATDTLFLASGSGYQWVGNETTEVIGIALDADLIDLVDGTLTGSKVGTGIAAGNITTGTLPAARLGADSIDAITEIAAALRSGIDGDLITGTAGATGECAQWNADGDLVTSGAACGSGGGGATTDAGTVTHVTGTTDDFAIGGTDSSAAFFFDEEAGVLTINVPNGGVDATPAAATGSVYTFKEGSNNGSNVITVTAPAAMAADRACTLDDSATPFDGCVAADVVLVASGIESLATNAIASGACDTTDTGVTATGVTGNDVIAWTPVGDISGVTGYAPVTTGALIIYPYATTNAVNFKVCNPTSSSITPGAVSLNWKVFR